jgi:di- and tripeptidase
MEEPETAAIRHSSHRITTAGSVQALVIDQDVLFAGLQGGTIAAYSLDTYELLSSVHAHEESVLGLALSDDHELLFSTGADSVVKVWSSHSLEPLYFLHSYHDIGDIFCVAHSSRKGTAFFGAQNGSISWHHLELGDVVSPKVAFTPGSRKHRFFDSHGPGGSLTPLQRRAANGHPENSPGHRLTIRGDHYKAYAHNSYIYSMLLAKGLFRHNDEEEVLISGGGAGEIRLWKIDDLAETGLVQLYQFKNKGSSILSLACSGSFLYAGLSEGAANIYNLSSCQLVQRLTSGKSDVSQICVSQGMLCCGTADGWVKVSLPLPFSSQC